MDEGHKHDPTRSGHTARRAGNGVDSGEHAQGWSVPGQVVLRLRWQRGCRLQRRLVASVADTVPPLNYGAEKGPPPDYRGWVNKLSAEIDDKGIAHPDSAA
jgi:hypothetical protein